MNQIVGLFVVRNEADRYLDACLDWHAGLFDDLLVYDDWSDDDSDLVVQRHPVGWTRRPDNVPAWIEHEGKFRQDSLIALEAYAGLREGDWIMGVDADEFLVSTGDHRERLDAAIAHAESVAAKSVIIPRPEIWQLDPPAERIDGYWGSIRCSRLFRWEPGGTIADKAMGCGSEPTYVARSEMSQNSYGLHLLHLGYAHRRDREEKFHRYTSLLDHGHNNTHIQSILYQPQLKPWTSFMPPIWRGIHESGTTSL